MAIQDTGGSFSLKLKHSTGEERADQTKPPNLMLDVLIVQSGCHWKQELWK